MATALVALLVAALDGTAVGTILPTMTEELGRGSAYFWLISGFIVAQTTASLVFGGVADRFGLRTAFVVTMAIFAVGSAWVGQASSLGSAIAGRVIQGIGAGGIPTLTYTVVALLSTPEQRPKRQALVSAVWGLAAIAGPAAGALAAATVGWRWIFHLNIPVSILVLTRVLRTFPVQVSATRQQLRWTEMLTFSVGTTFLLFTLGARSSGFSMRGTLLCAGITLLAAVSGIYGRHRAVDERGFGRLERRALLASGCAATILYGSITFVPQMLQTLMGLDVTASAFGVLSAALGWVAGASVAGKVLVRHGYRAVVLVGAVLMVAGSAGLVFAAVSVSALLAIVGQVGIGVGMGAVSSGALIMAQNAAATDRLATVTASIQVARSIGAAVGITALAETQHWILSRYGVASTIGWSGHDVRLAATPSALASSQAFAACFGLACVLAVVTLIVAWRFPARFGDAAVADAPHGCDSRALRTSLANGN